MKRIKTLLCMIAMTLAATTWASWSPGFASDDDYDIAVEESLEQYDEAVDEDGAYEEDIDEEWNDQDMPEMENQDNAIYTN